MKIKVADFVFEVANIYPYSEKAAAEYKSDESPDFSFSISPEAVAWHRERLGTAAFSPEYTEWIEIYRMIAAFIEKRGGILMHGAVIGFDGYAYMFTAPSGTGKTTHIMQWKKLYGDRVSVINGDKPILRDIGGQFMAYGTPWCGKEKLSVNTKAPLKGIALLSRAEENSIERVDAGKHLPFLLKQVYLHRDADCLSNSMDFLDRMLSAVPVYDLKCNISTDAALVASKLMCSLKG